MNQQIDESMVYTIKELAKVLKISKSNAYQLARTPGFPKIKIGKRILVPKEELKKWLISQCNEVRVWY